MSSAFSAEIKKLLVKLEDLQCDFDEIEWIVRYSIVCSDPNEVWSDFDDGFPLDEIAVELFDCVRELKYLIDFVMPKVAGV